MANRDYFILPSAPFGCELDVDQLEQEARDDALVSRQKVDAAVSKAADETAEREGAEKAAEVERATKARVGRAVDTGNPVVLSARAEALERGAKVIELLREFSEVTRLAVERDLAGLDARVVRAREKLKGHPVPERAIEERQLAVVGQSTADLRRDVRVLEMSTIQSIEAFQKQLAARLSDTAGRLARVEEAVKSPAAVH